MNTTGIAPDGGDRPAAPNIRASILPPLAALAELIVLFAVIVGVHYLYPSADITAVQPHPFWLPVLLLSLQYGTASGLLAAITAIILQSVFGFPEQDIGENLFNYLVRVWAQPILWLAAAVVLGQFRMRQIEDKRDLTRALDELASQRAAIERHANALRLRCDELERQLTGRSELPEATLLTTFGSIGDDRTRSASEGFEELFGRCLAGASGVLLAASDGRFLPVASAGAGSGSAGLLEQGIASSDPLVAALTGGEVISVGTPRGENLLAGRALAGVALRAVDGRVLALMLATNLDARRLATSGPAAMKAMAAVLAPLAERDPKLVAQPRLEYPRPVDATPTTDPASASYGGNALPRVRWRSRVHHRTEAGAAPTEPGSGAAAEATQRRIKA